jgi:hypothetical protein
MALGATNEKICVGDKEKLSGATVLMAMAALVGPHARAALGHVSG